MRTVRVKFPLTEDQVLGLLCIGGRCNLFAVRSISINGEMHMTNQTYLIARVAQGLLAVSATVASILVFQLA